MTIFIGDSLEWLRKLPSESVNCIVTSPPYYQVRDYGVVGQYGLENTVQAYIDNMVAVFCEARRVLRDDGTLWLNIADTYSAGGRGKGDTQMQASNVGSFTGDVANHRVPGFAPKNLLMIPHRLAIALQADGWYIRNDIVWHKCLSGGTTLYAKTQKGEMPITVKDLARLNPNTVQLWTGEKWSNVVGMWETSGDVDRKMKSQIRRSAKHRTGEPQPVDSDIEIRLRSGESIGCTRDHRWITQRGIVCAAELQVGDILDRTVIPEPKEPVSPKHIPDDIGWFVGLYLAEGSMSDGDIQIAGHTKEVERFNRVSQIAADYGSTISTYNYQGNSASIVVRGGLLPTILDMYIAGNTAYKKHLTVRCWQRSNAFLQNVLDGYLSGDGHWDSKNNRWRIGFTNNDYLAQDFRTLSGRLGFSLRLNRTKNQLGDRTFPGWRGQIRFEVSANSSNKSDTEIVAINQTRARKFWDIAIEDEPHLFALASGVLTHNSNPMPESVTDRCTKSHEYVFLCAKSERYYFDADAIREQGTGDTRVKPFGITDNTTFRHDRNGNTYQVTDTRNKRDVWSINTESSGVAHFATMPLELAETCIKAGCPETVCAECGMPYVAIVESHSVVKAERGTQRSQSRALGMPQQSGISSIRHIHGYEPTCTCNGATRPGIVLDPFGGAGTTALAAIKNNRHYQLIELNIKYVGIAQQRIAAFNPYQNTTLPNGMKQLSLFQDES